MCDDWMPGIKLPLTLEQFHQLPRNPAYKYEYLGGQAYLTPRPRNYHALLELKAGTLPALEDTENSVIIRPIQRADIPDLERVFAAAFHRYQPFASLDKEILKEAAHTCLERTCTGQDGPLIEQASFLAFSEAKKRTIGAIFITLLPAGDPSDWDSFSWSEPPPADCIALRQGRPHLTWIFVSPLHVSGGVGTALLRAAVQELLRLGFTQLASTFLLGNDSSMLWHWRHGFQLQSYPGSMRRMRKKFNHGSHG
jgi:GNAT superfamily N-acetyltransferase